MEIKLDYQFTIEEDVDHERAWRRWDGDINNYDPENSTKAVIHFNGEVIWETERVFREGQTIDGDRYSDAIDHAEAHLVERLRQLLA